MQDRHKSHEMAGVLSLGLLSERMVLALGRVGRSEELTEEDRQAIQRATELFELMTTRDVIVVGATVNRMLSDASYIDALEALQGQTDGGDIEDYAERYSELLRKVLAGEAGEDERAELEALRNLFVEVGLTTLSRANEISRTRQESPWLPQPHRMSSSFS
jgi:hypothetical protein